MTWFSHLTSQIPSQRRLAEHNNNHRARPAQRRRRMPSLETLERRALLANVTVSAVGVPTAGEITITGDNHNDAFTITEDGNNEVTVTGSGYTTINNTFSPVTRYGVTNINVYLPHGLVVNTDSLLLTQTPGTTSGIANVTITVVPSSTTSPIVATDLYLTVTGVVNTGALTVNDGTATSQGGSLGFGFVDGFYGETGMFDSTFASVSVTQTGSSPASVMLSTVQVTGNVTVTEGTNANDNIQLTDGDKFTGSSTGVTTLTQNGSGNIMIGSGATPTTPSKFETVKITQQPTSGNVNGTITVDAVDYMLNLNITQSNVGYGNVYIGTNQIVSDVAVQTNIYQDGHSNVVLGSATTVGVSPSNPYAFTTSSLTIFTGGNGMVEATDSYVYTLCALVDTTNTSYYTDGGGNGTTGPFNLAGPNQTF